MSNYNRIAGVDETNNFPVPIRQALVASEEFSDGLRNGANQAISDSDEVQAAIAQGVTAANIPSKVDAALAVAISLTGMVTAKVDPNDPTRLILTITQSDTWTNTWEDTW